MRDIEKYAKDYSEEGFESLQEKYRRRKLLEILKEFVGGFFLVTQVGKWPIRITIGCTAADSTRCRLRTFVMTKRFLLQN